ncbi:NAD-dependent epimerase/dehydratase family protein [Antrihabitans sp. YC2-6]|uniref:NAD-dependent epimerase/dehydratase family protein n=1 Tax=Antrihabitans sp. YC2-6 TaxID=2799498 RepID=UPI0018F5ECA4|nr:NAD-dependent epimerase/dehydratase family protein [Antrihabitans sp. YC2-6]MBJ8345757.1 NAD-dependent epimerase/dehydratase family protein [Antrihabitans sp. YC2-6]
MRVAVTGAAGFLGMNLVEALASQGHEVLAIDRVPAPARTDGDVSWLRADILDPADMVRVLTDVEVVYHLVAMVTLAQQDPVAWRVNTEGARIVAEAALTVGARKFVHCSSLHAYDQYNLVGPLSEESARSTRADLPVYDRSKWFGEVAVRAVVERGLDAVICNPTGIFGPVDYGPSRLNSMVRLAANGRMPLGIAGHFDLIDVRDVATGMIRASEKGRAGENYILAGHEAELIEVFRTAARVLGRRGPAFALPLRLVERVVPIVEPIGARFGSDLISKGAIDTLLTSPIVDGTKALRELGHDPRPTDETVRDLIAFFVTQGRLTG